MRFVAVRVAHTVPPRTRLTRVTRPSSAVFFVRVLFLCRNKPLTIYSIVDSGNRVVVNKFSNLVITNNIKFLFTVYLIVDNIIIYYINQIKV